MRSGLTPLLGRRTDGALGDAVESGQGFGSGFFAFGLGQTLGLDGFGLAQATRVDVLNAELQVEQQLPGRRQGLA